MPVDSAAPYIPENPTLPKLREAAAGCRACPLWQTGTQTVFGEGSEDAQVMLVGEQPGDQEDKQGKPFVGLQGASSTRPSSSRGSTGGRPMSRTR